MDAEPKDKLLRAVRIAEASEQAAQRRLHLLPIRPGSHTRHLPPHRVKTLRPRMQERQLRKGKGGDVCLRLHELLGGVRKGTLHQVPREEERAVLQNNRAGGVAGG